MKKILFTQRVDEFERYKERRDSVDQNISRLIASCGFLPIPLCNLPELTDVYIKKLAPDGILLTGGNNLHKYGGDAPERDLVENRLIETSLEGGVPLVGICRGMQIIADYFGAKLEEIDGHIAFRHFLLGQIRREVNSFHKFGCLELPLSLEVLARAEDGVIEALRHKDSLITGIMWHPEREKPFVTEDIKLMQRLFSGSYHRNIIV